MDEVVEVEVQVRFQFRSEAPGWCRGGCSGKGAMLVNEVSSRRGVSVESLYELWC